MRATSAPTPAARASSSITSMRISVESMSITTSRFDRRYRLSRCSDTSKPALVATDSSVRLSASLSRPGGSSAWISTEASVFSDRRPIFSMLAPSAASVDAIACRCGAPSVGPMAVMT